MGQKRICVRSRRAAVALVLIGVVFGGMRLGTSWASSPAGLTGKACGDDGGGRVGASGASSQPRGLWTAMIKPPTRIQTHSVVSKTYQTPCLQALQSGGYPKGLAKLVLLKPWNGKNTAYPLASWSLSNLPTFWV